MRPGPEQSDILDPSCANKYFKQYGGTTYSRAMRRVSKKRKCEIEDLVSAEHLQDGVGFGLFWATRNGSHHIRHRRASTVEYNWTRMILMKHLSNEIYQMLCRQGSHSLLLVLAVKATLRISGLMCPISVRLSINQSFHAVDLDHYRIFATYVVGTLCTQSLKGCITVC